MAAFIDENSPITASWQVGSRRTAGRVQLNLLVAGYGLVAQSLTDVPAGAASVQVQAVYHHSLPPGDYQGTVDLVDADTGQLVAGVAGIGFTVTPTGITTPRYGIGDWVLTQLYGGGFERIPAVIVGMRWVPRSQQGEAHWEYSWQWWLDSNLLGQGNPFGKDPSIRKVNGPNCPLIYVKDPGAPILGTGIRIGDYFVSDDSDSYHIALQDFALGGGGIWQDGIRFAFWYNTQTFTSWEQGLTKVSPPWWVDRAECAWDEG